MFLQYILTTELVKSLKYNTSITSPLNLEWSDYKIFRQECRWLVLFLFGRNFPILLKFEGIDMKNFAPVEVVKTLFVKLVFESVW